MKKNIFGIAFLFILFLIIGTSGAIETGLIPEINGWIRIAVLLGALIGSMYFGKLYERE